MNFCRVTFLLYLVFISYVATHVATEQSCERRQIVSGDPECTLWGWRCIWWTIKQKITKHGYGTLFAVRDFRRSYSETQSYKYILVVLDYFIKLDRSRSRDYPDQEILNKCYYRNECQDTALLCRFIIIRERAFPLHLKDCTIAFFFSNLFYCSNSTRSIFFCIFL